MNNDQPITEAGCDRQFYKDVRVHELWCWPTVYEKILSGQRTFDIRKDTDYRAGDIIRYRERQQDLRTNELLYTGRQLDAYIRCVVHGTRTDAYEQPKRENPIQQGYVVMGIKVSKQSIKHG